MTIWLRLVAPLRWLVWALSERFTTLQVGPEKAPVLLIFGEVVPKSVYHEIAGEIYFATGLSSNRTQES